MDGANILRTDGILMNVLSIHIEGRISSCKDWIPRLSLEFMCSEGNSVYETLTDGYKVVLF